MRALLEAIVTHPDGIDPVTLDAIIRYTKLFWINTGGFNNITARKFVPECAPEAFAAAVRVAAANGAALPLAAGESVDDLLARLHRPFFDREFEAIVTCKTPGEGRDILEASANNLYVGVVMKDLEGFEERYATQLPPDRKPSRGLPKRCTGSMDATRTTLRESSRTSRRRSRSLRRRLPLRCRRWFVSIAAVRSKTAGATTSRGSPTTNQPWTRSTASSRSTWTLAARKARGRRWSITSTRKRPRRCGQSPITRSGSRTTCRGIRSGASRR